MNQNTEMPRIDCLLIYPPWTVLFGRSMLANSLPPLGVLSIASFLEESGFTVRVIDVHAERMKSTVLREKIREYKPRFVGITVLSSMVVSSNAIAKLVKEEVSDCTVVLGGVHAEAYPETMLQNSAVDIVVRGDGEHIMRDIVAGNAWDTIASINYRTENLQVKSTPQQAINMDIDSLPMPAYHLVDFSRYFPSATSYRNLPAINVLMTRGCPGKCTFCNSAYTTLRSRSPLKVYEQIQHLRTKYGIRQVQFFDDTFTVNKKGVFELCRLLTENKVDITFTCYVRGDCFSNEMAKALKGAGCHQIMVGIETGSPKIMKVIGKPIKKDQYKKIVEIARDNGIEVRAGFIIGNMEETWETMQESLDFAIELDLDFFQLSISTPYPGTQLFKQALEEDRLEHLEYKFYGQSRPIVRLDHLSHDDIMRFEKYAFKKFYMRPITYWRQLKRIKNLRQIKDLFDAFNLLIANKFVNSDPDWADWDEATEADQYDLRLDIPELPTRLTYQLREEFEVPVKTIVGAKSKPLSL